MIEVELDPEVWARGPIKAWKGPGEPIYNSLLQFQDGQRQQCCIGVMLTHLGAEDKQIEWFKTIPISIRAPWNHEVVKRLTENRPWGYEKQNCLNTAYKINDRPLNEGDEERVRLLNLACEPAGVRFILKKKEVK